MLRIRIRLQYLTFFIKTQCAVQIRIGIKMESRIRIRISIKTMLIHNNVINRLTSSISQYVKQRASDYLSDVDLRNLPESALMTGI